MAQKPPSRVELLRGTLDLLILRTLLPGPSHGHAIAKHIQRTSEDLLQVETGSLYPALYRLEAKGWIAASWELSDKGKRARYYRITPDGAKAAGQRTIEMGRVRARHGTAAEAGRPRRDDDLALSEVHVVAAAAAQGGRAPRGAAVPSRRGSGRTPRPMGCRQGRGRMGRPPRPGQRHAAAGGHAHAVVVAPARAARAGRPLRPAGDVQEPPVHRARRAVARARDRRQHGDLQLHGRDSVALAAGVGSGVAGRGEVAEQAVKRRQRRRVRDALHGRQHLPRPARESRRPSSRFPRSSACRRRRRRSCPASSRTNRPAA